MSLNFEIPEKRDQVVTPLKWGFWGGLTGFTVAAIATLVEMPAHATFSILTATTGIVVATAATALVAAAVGSVMLNRKVPAQAVKVGAGYCKDAACELEDKVSKKFDAYLPARKPKATAQDKPEDKAPKAVTPARDAARSQDEQRNGGYTFNNCTFNNTTADEIVRGRGRGKSPSRKNNSIL